MNAVTVSSKFQVVIPKEVREAAGLRAGQRVQVFHYEGRIELVPVRNIKDLRGSLAGIDASVPRDNDRI